MKDAVVVIQSDHLRWESHLSCNSKASSSCFFKKGPFCPNPTVVPRALLPTAHRPSRPRTNACHPSLCQPRSRRNHPPCATGANPCLDALVFDVCRFLCGSRNHSPSQPHGRPHSIANPIHIDPAALVSQSSSLRPSSL